MEQRGNKSWAARVWVGVRVCAVAVCLGVIGSRGASEAAEFAGISEAQADATLTAPVAGTVHRILYREGDRVDAGKPIVELDQRLEELEVARRELVLANASAILARTEKLAATSQAVAVEELDKQRAEKRLAESELEIAREQLRKRTILAPFAGVVVDLFGLDVGEGCQPQTPVVRIVDVRRCWFVLNLEARVAERLKLKQAVEIRFPGVGENEAARVGSGTIEFISPVADPASGLVRVKAVFDNERLRVAAGVAGTLVAGLQP